MGKVAACAITAAVLGVVLRRYSPELSLLLVLMAGLWMLYPAVRGLAEITDLMGELVRLAQVSDMLLEPVVKTVLLSMFTKLTVEVCRAAGEGGIGAFVELTGTVLALVTAAPLVRAVVELMGVMLT